MTDDNMPREKQAERANRNRYSGTWGHRWRPCVGAWKLISPKLLAKHTGDEVGGEVRGDLKTFRIKK
jgi:hypothetical protein